MFKLNDRVDQLFFHWQDDGNICLKDSDEYREQEEYWDQKKRNNKQLLDKMNAAIKDDLGEDPRKLQQFKSNLYLVEGNEAAQKKSLRNQFNFQERACMTFPISEKNKGIKTDPPVCSNFQYETTQWQVFDAYMEAYGEKERREKEEAMKNKKEKKPVQIQQQHIEDPLYSTSMKRALKIMERMIVQNADKVKFWDYKYYEDDTEDAENNNFGSVLPLWRFSTDKSRKRNVTSIQWHPKYRDLFCVGYGNYSFIQQSTGLICCYTIKNPTWPEYHFTTESGVMSLDFHPLYPALLAVGLYDGTVMVYDIRLKGNNKPIYMSTVRTHKHTDPVWQVRWNTDENLKNLNFYSISSDGRVTNWTLMKNKLEAEEVIKLRLVVDESKGLTENKKESFMYGLAGGMCFDFNKYQTHLFLVGTEEGKIHLCSKAYSGQYLETYEGHYHGVYAVKWNHYHPRVFLSCSADWTIKLWDMQITRPIMTFDLQNAVGDIEWAPYSSTVFAACTYEGRLFVWDLHQQKHTHLCEHRAMKQAYGLHVAFNSEDPILLVGDHRGGVNSFKLSQSLHRGPLVYTPTKEDLEKPEDQRPVYPTSQELEQEKMERFLDSLDKHVY